MHLSISHTHLSVLDCLECFICGRTVDKLFQRRPNNLRVFGFEQQRFENGAHKVFLLSMQVPIDRINQSIDAMQAKVRIKCLSRYQYRYHRTEREMPTPKYIHITHHITSPQHSTAQHSKSQPQPQPEPQPIIHKAPTKPTSQSHPNANLRRLVCHSGMSALMPEAAATTTTTTQRRNANANANANAKCTNAQTLRKKMLLTCRTMLKYMLERMRKYAQISANMHKYAQICSNMQEFAQVRTNTLKQAQIGTDRHMHGKPS